MKPERILEEQRITVKRGRMNGLGFEPCHNAFFDFYLNTKYFNPPLLQLEDVTFFLFIRKNINDNNPEWKMPSLRHIKQRFGMGYGRYAGIMKRLERAKLIVKVSGVRGGQPNVNNEYFLSDPIPYMDEFVAVMEAGLFDPESETDPRHESEIDPWVESEIDSGGGSDSEQLKQTSSLNIPGEQTDDLIKTAWKNVLAILKQHLQAETYHRFLEDVTFISLDEGTITLATNKPYVRDWLALRMDKRLVQLFKIEMSVLAGAKGPAVWELEVVLQS